MAQVTNDQIAGVPVDPTVNNAPPTTAPKTPQAPALTPLPTTQQAKVAPAPAGTSTAQGALVDSGLKVDTTPTDGGGTAIDPGASTIAPPPVSPVGGAPGAAPTGNPNSTVIPMPANYGQTPAPPLPSWLTSGVPTDTGFQVDAAGNYVGPENGYQGSNGSNTDPNAFGNETAAQVATDNQNAAVGTAEQNVKSGIGAGEFFADTTPSNVNFGGSTLPTTTVDTINAELAKQGLPAMTAQQIASWSPGSTPGFGTAIDGKSIAAGTSIPQSLLTAAATPPSKLTPSGPTDVNGATPGGAATLPSAATSPGTSSTASIGAGGVPTNAPGAQNITPIDPTNDLRSSLITDTPSARTSNLNGMVDSAASNLAGVDRVKLAQEDFDALSKAGEPAYEAAERSATQRAAANGQLGSGMLDTSYGDLALQRQRDLDTLEEQLSSAATTGSIQDQFDKTNTLSGLAGQSQSTDNTATNDLRNERSYEDSQANDAFTKGLAQYEAEQQAKNTDFSQGLQLLGLGDAGNPASTLEGAAGQVNPAGDAQAIAALAKQMGIGGGATSTGATGATGTSSTDPATEAIIQQILARGLPGVQATGGSGPTIPGAPTTIPGVQATTPQVPGMTGPTAATPIDPLDPYAQY